MSTRREAREIALQVLFQEGFCETPFLNPKWIEAEGDDADFSRRLVQGVFLHHREIDRLIGEHAEHWDPNRMALVDHNVLRVAIFEMVFLKETPPSVVMNEAIEISKKYGTENSGGFVNGILDAIAARSVSGIGVLTGVEAL